MAGTIIKSQKIWLGALKLDGQLHTIDLDLSLEALDDTRLGDDAVSMIVGRGLTQLQLAGYWDPVGATAVDGQLFSDIGATLAYIIDVTGAGEGGKAYLGDVLATGRPISGQHGQQAGMTLAGATRNTIPIQGFLSEISSGLGAGTVSGTGKQLGAVGAGQKLWAALCMTAGSTPNVDVIVESDDNAGFTSPTTRISFANRTTPGSELKSQAGAITDDYFRAKVTVNSGSAVALAVAIGIW